MPTRPTRLNSPEEPGSATLAAVLLQPFTSVSPARVFAVSANTQPLIVPASTELPPAWADIVKLVPARMFPSNVPAGELPTLIVAASSTIQKMLSGFALFSRLKIKVPFTVKAPLIRMTKTAFGLPAASKFKVMPVVVEMSPVDAYTLLPVNVMPVDRDEKSGCVGVNISAALNAPSKAVNAAATVGSLGAG